MQESGSTRREAKLVIVDDPDGWTYYPPGTGPKVKRLPPASPSHSFTVFVMFLLVVAWLVGSWCGFWLGRLYSG
jgi:hypothetical protein